MIPSSLYIIFRSTLQIKYLKIAEKEIIKKPLKSKLLNLYPLNKKWFNVIKQSLNFEQNSLYEIE